MRRRSLRRVFAHWVFVHRVFARRRMRLPWALGWGVALLAACSGEARRPNVLLVSIDTLRADRVGAWGCPRDTTPQLDRLAARSLVYRNAFAPSSWTLPGHAAILSGRHPVELGVEDVTSVLPPDVPLLAQILRQAGYRTGAFVDSTPGGFVGGQRGFRRGFDSYEHSPHAPSRERFDVATTVDRALAWMDERRVSDPEQPFFLFVHTKAVHSVAKGTRPLGRRFYPYQKPPSHQFRFIDRKDVPFTWNDPELGQGVEVLLNVNRKLHAGEMTRDELPERWAEVLLALYDAGVAYTDEHLGRLLDGLGELGLDEDTIVVVTSDHGESFLEHNLLLHVEIYDEVLRVPLIVHRPGGPAGVAVDDAVSIADIAPTLLSWLDLPVPDECGPERLPQAPGAGGARPLFFHTRSGDGVSRGEGQRAAASGEAQEEPYRSVAVLEGAWKLVCHNFGGVEPTAVELYDVERDPSESAPVEDPQRAARLRERLDAWLRTARPAESHSEPLSEETRKALSDLGYVR